MLKSILFYITAAAMLPFFYTSAHAATVVTISVNASSSELAQLDKVQLRLQRFQDGIYTSVDSGYFTNGKAVLTANEKTVAFYKVSGQGFAELTMIVSNNEQKIFFAGSLMDFMLGGYIIFDSRENQCVLKVKAAETELAKTYFNIISKSKVTKDLPTLRRLDSLMNRAQTAYNTKAAQIAEGYKDCHCAQFMIPNLKSALKTNATQSIDSFFLLHAFDSLHLDDERLLSFPNFFDMLKAYRNNFVPKTNQGQKTFMDVVFRQRQVHPKTRTYLFNFYLQQYTAERQPELIAYLLDANKNLAIDTLTPDGMLAHNIKKLLPGNIAYDAVLQNREGALVSVSQTFSGSDYGVILLYNHECDHCLELIPEIQGILDSSAKKITVYAIDTHHEREDWLKFLDEKKLPFTNVFLSAEMGSTIANKYAMLSIPIMIITDNKLKIVSRFATPDMLRALR